MAAQQVKDLEHFESVVNDYLRSVRELEYALVHFIKKSNKTTALGVRNLQREVAKYAKEYKDTSISFFNG